MKFKIKEKEVLREHKNEITRPTIKYNCWKTRVRGAKNDQIVRSTYEKLIEALYDFYFNKKPQPLTLGDCIKKWISSREESGAIEYATALHYLDDYKKYVQGSFIDNKDITTITKAQFISFFEKLAGDGSDMRKSTFNNVRTVVNGGFNYANMLDGYDCIDPTKIKTSDIVKRCYEPEKQSKS